MTDFDSTSSKQPDQLVEHFFRHEYANLVSVLTRAFGFARIDLVEDMVSSAIIKAMNSWKQNGIPKNPAGWIHRVARNQILDSIRREKVHEKALAFALQQTSENQSTDEVIDRWLDEERLPDSLLSMMFVCCHPMLDHKTQIALTLKILCGFSVAEIARGLLLSVAAVKKRIQRAKSELAENNVSIEFPTTDELQARLSVVHDVLYLMFNEGYSTSHGIEPIRDDICEEAARLCHMLCLHPSLNSPNSCALLSLMLFHASRLEARTDSLGNIVLLGDQDRKLWNQDLIDEADKWLVKSVKQIPSRFHFEAVIAQFHCSARSLEETDWEKIILFYNRLMELFPSPVYRLNRAIALAQTGKSDEALEQLELIRNRPEMKDYFLVDCACAFIYEKTGDQKRATDCYLAALNSSLADHQKQLIQKKLAALHAT